jgi:1-acyl-sn-glycerol-3-phosphate acyltransferase
VAIPLVRAVAGLACIPDDRRRSAVQPSGGLILAVNHISSLDPVLLARFVLDAGRIPRFLAKSELFETPVLRNLLRGARQIPVYRERANAADALRDAVTAVRAGELVIIYPEGTITGDPEYWPMMARNGVARLALETNAPVVPVAQWGVQAVVGPGMRIRPRRVHSVLPGSPIDVTAYRTGGPPTAAALHAVTTTVLGRIRDQLVELRGQPAPSRIWDPKQHGRTSDEYVRAEGAAA